MAPPLPSGSDRSPCERWVDRVFANAKRRAIVRPQADDPTPEERRPEGRRGGVYHGLREPHLQRHLDELVFRLNRRRTPAAAFGRLLGLSLTLQPATYKMLTGRS